MSGDLPGDRLIEARLRDTRRSQKPPFGLKPREGSTGLPECSGVP